MKPASFDHAQDKRGFTLIELLVVISIIAILSVIGITVFTGVQKGARDARRRSDIKAIATALEIQYLDRLGRCPLQVSDSTGYCPIQAIYFSNNTIPTHPNGAAYCISYPGTPGGASLPANNPATMPDPLDGSSNCSFTDFKAIDTSDPSLNSIAWRVCTKLESGDIVCQRSLR